MRRPTRHDSVVKFGLAWTNMALLLACASDLPKIDGDDTSTTSHGTGGRGTTPATDDSTTVTTGTTATDHGTETATTVGEPQSCANDGDCMDTSKPFCLSTLQECVSCSELLDPGAACSKRDPALPVCNEGVCVQCTSEAADACAAEALICDDTTHACVGCTEHVQCGSAACNIFAGTCITGSVVTVGTARDFSTLTDAVASLGPEGTIRVADGIYDESVVVGTGMVVAVLADAGALPVWQNTGITGPQLRAAAGSTVVMDGIALRHNPAIMHPALQVDGGSVWVDRGTIAQNDGVGLIAVGAEVVLRNSFIGGAVDLAAAQVTGSTLSVRYSTVGASTGDATAIVCDVGSWVTVDDSIIISRGEGPEVVCESLMATNTATNMPLRGTGNEAVGVTMATWFASYNGGDFHLTSAGEGVFGGIAKWNFGDPLVDIDGMPRIGMDGTAEHAGGDVP